ncbi:MAG TPA: DUF4388 domain-containing protein [Blastocatellia bacterium]|nr:DUF4388 domain-containing protein [Blastocatellia bacterium]
MDGKDRRTAKRISHICEVECEGAGASRLTTRINDLSATGAFIDSMSCFPVGTILKLRFRVRDVQVETTGEVRYCMKNIGMGVHFLGLAPEQSAALVCLVEGRPYTPPPPEEPRAAELPPPPPAQLQNILLGSFAVVSLFDVIQMIENGRLTGTLRMTLPNVEGAIYFNEGQIVNAKVGSKTTTLGIKALDRLLGATEGTFEFVKSSHDHERVIFAPSNTALLLDLLDAKGEMSAMPSAESKH